MAYLLDTNAVIALMKNHSRVVERVRRAGRSELLICAPVEAELWFGVNKSSRVDENRHHLLTLLEWLPSLPFSGEATRLCGEIRADLARKGTPIGPYDLQIAAIGKRGVRSSFIASLLQLNSLDATVAQREYCSP